MLTYQIAVDILHKLFPVPEEDLLRLYFLLKETDADIEEFRFYFYKVLTEEEWDEIDLEYTGVTAYFYWYVLDRMQNDFCSLLLPAIKMQKSGHLLIVFYPDPDLKYVDLSELEDEERFKILDKLDEERMNSWCMTEGLYVNEDYVIPRYRLDGNGEDITKLDGYFQRLDQILETMPEEKQTKMFKWFINQFYQDNDWPPKYKTTDPNPDPSKIIDFSKVKSNK